jgi:hypothetical protein
VTAPGWPTNSGQASALLARRQRLREQAADQRRLVRARLRDVNGTLSWPGLLLLALDSPWLRQALGRRR